MMCNSNNDGPIMQPQSQSQSQPQSQHLKIQQHLVKRKNQSQTQCLPLFNGSGEKQQQQQQQGGKTAASATIMHLNKHQNHQNHHHKSSRVDIACFVVYVCSTTCLNLPVVLLPVAAAEQTSSVSSYIASVAAIAVTGSAVGKLVNGFVCQEFGNQRSSLCYLVGLAIMTKWFASGQLLYAYAGMEFCGSLQWTALNVLLMKKYADDPIAYSRSVATMSLASTTGQFLSKTVGMILLQRYYWKTIANIGSLIALSGAIVVFVFLVEDRSVGKQPFSLSKIINDSKVVMSSPMFWFCGIAHSATTLGRSSDRVLGAFFHEATDFSPRLCGGLTLSSTLGLVYGLSASRIFAQLTPKHKERFIRRRYYGAVLATLSLALSASATGISSTTKAIWIAMSGTLLTASTVFLFFNIPNMVAKTFVDREAICLSILDAVSFFTAAPLWKLFGLMLTEGYSASWLLFASIFVVSGTIMTRATRPLVQE